MDKKAIEYSKDWFSTNDLKKMLPQIERLKTKNGKEIFAEAKKVICGPEDKQTSYLCIKGRADNIESDGFYIVPSQINDRYNLSISLKERLSLIHI